MFINLNISDQYCYYITMRINEKNLISFATSKTPIDREGFLGKKGEVNKNFQKRWFVLKGNLFFYFERKGDKEPIGVIILEGCTIELAENEEYFAFKIVFHGNGNRIYILCAENQEDMEGWMKVLSCASYDYMKLMVSELQRQLDEINETEQLIKAGHSQKLKMGALGLPMNRSDSCLYNHAQTGKTRFNPFDKWKVDKDNYSNTTNDLIDISTDLIPNAEVTLNIGNTTRSQRYSFKQLHEYYGQTFRRLFENIKKEHKFSNSCKDNAFSHLK